MQTLWLTVTRGQHVSYIHYKYLQGYSWSQEKDAFLLTLHRKNGRKTVVGVPNQEIKHTADQLLKDSAVTRLA
jgi:hypothetical protein